MNRFRQNNLMHCRETEFSSRFECSWGFWLFSALFHIFIVYYDSLRGCIVFSGISDLTESSSWEYFINSLGNGGNVNTC